MFESWDYAVNRLGLSLNAEEDSNSKFHVMKPLQVDKMMNLVMGRGYDIALADGLSCRHYCDRFNEGAMDVFQDARFQFHNVGVFLPKHQSELFEWVNEHFLTARSVPEIRNREMDIYETYNGIFFEVR